MGQSDDELTVAAVAGDTEAADAYFERNLGRLSVLARRISYGSTVDADDLLAESLVKLIARWANGDGPSERVVPYLVRMMQNRVIDEHRSPRSKVVDLDFEFELGGADDPNFRDLPLAADRDVVRRAMDGLPADYRLALEEVVVAGTPPRAIAEQLNRSPRAVSTLLTRAKAALRRAVLQTLIIDEAGSDECRQAAATLPSVVPDVISTSSAEHQSWSHIAGCDDCKRAWRRFEEMTESFGILPLLVLGKSEMLWHPVAGHSTAALASDPTRTPASAGHTVAELHPAKPRVIRAATRLAHMLRESNVALLAGGAAAAAVGAAGLLAAAGGGSGASVTQSSASLQANMTSAGPDRARVHVLFSVHERDWSITELRISTTRPLRITEQPVGWHCTGSVAPVCTPALASPSRADFEAGITGDLSGSVGWRVEVIARSGTRSLRGVATGTMGAAGDQRER